MVKTKSNVVKRDLYSCRQRYAALQWSNCCATNWATSPSARFALVIEYVSSIHPWANSRCWISQSERALCFSYVIIIPFVPWFTLSILSKIVGALRSGIKNDFQSELRSHRTLIFINITNGSLDGMRIDVIRSSKSHIHCLWDLSNFFSSSFIDFYSCEVISRSEMRKNEILRFDRFVSMMAVVFWLF